MTDHAIIAHLFTTGSPAAVSAIIPINNMEIPHISLLPVLSNHASFHLPLNLQCFNVLLVICIVAPSYPVVRMGNISDSKLSAEKNLKVPSERIPAGIYVSIKLDSGHQLPQSYYPTNPSPHASPNLSVEIRASFELGRMLGNGEVIGKLAISWDKLLRHGNEPFDDVHPSLTLKATVINLPGNQDDALFDSIIDCEIARETDAGHTRFAKYVTRNRVSDLNNAVEHFRLVLERCPVDHPDRAAALTNLACARLQGYNRNDFKDIDFITSLFRDALSLRPQGHLDHPLSLYYLTEALT
ncbi:uncharacterized protein EDB91DRAFT_1347913 [Suillus paluster]|uniref:uncharacterized protein n=1 Tax=Suillus paluster TaxID=48578 RepID=UPI001B874B80|nr:uncharacterized protein EDB91DRAFT_1347913 [Suillus paluster]KAG1737118.1 hypothetical protein EDB91DRAFT_1347913 [Suillus paluster]